MDNSYPPDAWKHLGKVLEQRRGQLGYGYRQRGEFLRSRGGPPPSVKMLARLERGERTSWPPGTLTLLEGMYGFKPGSFEAILSGGEPVPADGIPGRERTPDSPAGAPPLRAVPALPDYDGTDAAGRALADLVARYPDDDILRRIATRGGADAETRLREATGWLDVHLGHEGNGTAS